MVKGKEKGNSFERAISKELSLFITNNERDDIFYRSQNSGGRFTIRDKLGVSTHNQDGDITSMHPDGDIFTEVFSVELKHYKNINIWSIITGVKKSKSVLNFWNQTQNTAEKVNKIPILIARQNYKPILFITNNEYFKLSLSSKFDLYPILISNILTNDNSLFIYLYDSIIKLNSDKFNEMVKHIRNVNREKNKLITTEYTSGVR